MNTSTNPILVGDVARPRTTVFSLPDATSPADALRFLSAHSITSCPVFKDQKNGGDFVGFVSYLDLVKFVVADLSKGREVSPPTLLITSSDLDSALDDLTHTGSLLRTVKFQKIAKGRSLKPTDPLASANALTKRAHRLPVIQGAHLVNILTQSDIAKFWSENRPLLGAIGSMTVRGLSISNSVFVVRSDSVALDAFFALDHAKYSGAGVVDSEGKLVGQLSGSDLKKLGADLNMAKLLGPVSEWQHAAPVVQDTATLASVIAKTIEEKSHRVFTVDAQGRPTGVVTLTDILKACFRALAKPEGKKSDKSKKKGDKWKQHQAKEASKKAGKKSQKKGKGKGKDKKKKK